MSAESRLRDKGWVLPPEPDPPPGFDIPFEWVHGAGTIIFLSGHGAQEASGAIAPPFGQVPTQVPLPLALESARKAGLSLLGSLRRSIGDLDRVDQWLTVDGFVNARSGYEYTTAVVNPVSELILELFGDAGRHARTAVGVAALPMNLPVVVKASLLVHK